MELKLYPLLSTRSKRALVRRYYRQSKKHRVGQPMCYNPRRKLIERLVRQSGMTEAQVIEQLFKEREYLLQHNMS